MANIKQGRTFACVVVLCTASGLASLTQAEEQEAQIEEIRVTGSYIRRDNFDTPSPLQVINAFDIEASATTNLGDIIFNMPQNYGTEVLGVGTGGRGVGGPSDQGAVATPNLRGLGPRATMSLMDGHRIVFGDANFIYPRIAIQRIEVLMDGASALYGTDAVAGVVNYIPYKSFDGVKLEIERRDQWHASAPDYKLSLLTGIDAERSNFLFAMEYRQREGLAHRDTPKYMESQSGSAFGFRATGFPGSAFVPRRNAAGTVTNANLVNPNGLVDPGCGFDFMDPGDDPSAIGYRRWGVPTPTRLNCRPSIIDYSDWNGELDTLLAYTRYEFQFNDDITLHADLVFGRTEVETRNSPAPLVANSPFFVPGDLPGNPYRAYSNTTAVGAFRDPVSSATSQLLYAQDNCNFVDCAGGDGFPDRGYDGVVTPALQGVFGAPVLLAANAFAPNAPDPTNPSAAVDAVDGGIPFNEDVVLRNWTPFGKNIQGFPDAVRADGSIPRRRYSDNFRLSTGISVDIPDTSWIVDATAIYGWREEQYAIAFGSVSNFSTPQLQSMFDCVNPADVAAGNCVQFNPFSTSQFHVVNRVPQPVVTSPTDPGYNSDDVVNSIFAFNEDRTVSTSQIFDVVASGDLFELPAGLVGAAFGIEMRREEINAQPNALRSTGTATYGIQTDETHYKVEALDMFAELRIPVMDYNWSGPVELQLAARHSQNDAEDLLGGSSDSSFDSTVGKVGLLMQPTDWLSLRATWSEAFIVPTLTGLFTDRIEAPRVTTDPTCAVIFPIIIPAVGGEDVCSYQETGDMLPATSPIVEVRGGNPDLLPETADTYNIGFTLHLLDGDLSLQADYIEIDYQNVLTLLLQAAIANMEQIRFGEFYAAECGAAPTEACAIQARSDWILSEETPTYTRDVVGGQPIGFINTVTGGWTNLLSEEVHALDLQARYSFDAASLPFIGGEWGSFDLRLQATHMLKYEYQDDVEAPRVNAAGHRNFQGRPAIPDWRANGTVSWRYGSHRARLTARYHSGVDDRNFDGSLHAGNPEGEIDSATYWDVFYNYTFRDLFGRDGNTQVSVGVQNLFGYEADPIPQRPGLEISLDNPLRQIYTVRLSHDL
ncbi:MAG: TonB-dependent receptor [Pseudomonadales bacterium]